MIFNILNWLKIDVLLRKIFSAIQLLNINRVIKSSQNNFKYIPQGPGGIQIEGDLSKFKIHETSHLKSNTYIECTGGVTIGKYFHCGRGLTIISTNHNYRDASKIPYDETLIKKEVIIEDFVWIGLNVIILPGVKIGEGAIIGAGSVVTKSIPPLGVAAGNPAKILKFRDQVSFVKKKNEGKYF